MSTYDNLVNSRLSQGNPSSKMFWLKNLWVDKIQFPAYHKKLEHIKKHIINNQPIVIKKFNLNSGGRVTSHCRDSSEALPHTKEYQ